jgi:hypothetical protein
MNKRSPPRFPKMDVKAYALRPVRLFRPPTFACARSQRSSEILTEAALCISIVVLPSGISNGMTQPSVGCCGSQWRYCSRISVDPQRPALSAPLSEIRGPKRYLASTLIFFDRQETLFAVHDLIS